MPQSAARLAEVLRTRELPSAMTAAALDAVSSIVDRWSQFQAVFVYAYHHQTRKQTIFFQIKIRHLLLPG